MMLACKRCGKQFEYNELVGYSERPPICGVHCDYGIIIDAQNVLLAKMTDSLRTLLRIIEETPKSAFKNGVTDPTEQIDEGVVLTMRCVDSARLLVAQAGKAKQ